MVVKKHLLTYWFTSGIGAKNKSSEAGAHGAVIDHPTVAVEPATSLTRVQAPLVYTGFV